MYCMLPIFSINLKKLNDTLESKDTQNNSSVLNNFSLLVVWNYEVTLQMDG